MTGEAPLVSVIIPAHDAEGWIEAAIRSALGQTLADLEVIVVDDASRDGTWAVLEGLMAEDRRLHALRRNRQGGPAAARNAALGTARGRFVAMLDADDAFLPDRLERLVAAAEHHGADLLADDLLRRDFDSGTELGRHLGSAAIAGREGPLGLADLVARDMVEGGAGGPRAIGYLKPLMRRAVLERHGLRFDQAVRGSEDLLFYATCIARGARFRLLDAALYVYHVRAGSLSNRYGIARQQAMANRRMAALARAAGDGGAMALLAQRQARLDREAVAEEAAAGAWVRALSVILPAPVGSMPGLLRVLAGAARRRLVPGP